jgi:hypothetical protein
VGKAVTELGSKADVERDHSRKGKPVTWCKERHPDEMKGGETAVTDPGGQR